MHVFREEFTEEGIADIEFETLTSILLLLTGRRFNASKSGCSFNHERIEASENGGDAPHGIPALWMKVGHGET